MIKYCTKRLREQDGKNYYTNVFNNSLSVRIFLNKGEKIYKIDVRKAKDNEETPYVGWMKPDGSISNIFPNRILLEVCFPYGTKAATEHGDGKVIKVFIKEI